jgi:hypothetical protein
MKGGKENEKNFIGIIRMPYNILLLWSNQYGSFNRTNA